MSRRRSIALARAGGAVFVVLLIAVGAVAFVVASTVVQRQAVYGPAQRSAPYTAPYTAPAPASWPTSALFRDSPSTQPSWLQQQRQQEQEQRARDQEQRLTELERQACENRGGSYLAGICLP